MIISYNGQTIDTIHHKPMSDKEFAEIKSQILFKPTLFDVRQEIRGIFLGGNVQMNNIYHYFFKEMIFNTKLHHKKWSLMDVLAYKPLLEYFNGLVEQNKDVYPESVPKYKNIETAFRIGGGGVAQKPSNYKLDNAIYIIKKYNINGNYCDPSCGWGVRMIASMACGINYYGTDPNFELTEKLHEVSDLFREIDLFSPNVDIRTQGSETFIPNWENKMGFAFTSPPYFFLEDYKTGEQSTKKFPKYEDWLNGFYYKTFENVYRYLIPGGHYLVNIKNYKDFDLEEQTILMAKKAGFQYVGTESFENISRISETGESVDNDESIYVFQKL